MAIGVVPATPTQDGQSRYDATALQPGDSQITTTRRDLVKLDGPSIWGGRNSGNHRDATAEAAAVTNNITVGDNSWASASARSKWCHVLDIARADRGERERDPANSARLVGKSVV